MEKNNEIEMYQASVHSDKESNVDLLAERPEQGSNLLAFANVVCVVAGTGTLGLPYALALGGWIGVGVLILSLIMSIYTGVLLMRCLYYNGKYRLASYQEIGRHAYGKVGLAAVWFFHTSIIIGAPVMYMILAGTELKGLIHYDGLNATAWIWISAAVIAIPFVLLRTLREVAVMSIFGALATVVLVIVAVRGSIMDMSNPTYDNVTHSVVIWANLPITVASISICFGGNVVYMHVEESMRYPKSWNKILTLALIFCSVLYLLTAIPGYMAYGDMSLSPILANLPDDIYTKIGTIFIVAHVIMAAPILLTSFALEFERLCDITVARRGRFMERVYRSASRLVLIGICGGIASTVPYFGDFLSLLGALGNCTLIFILPILFYWKLFGGLKSMPKYEVVWCFFILIIGAVSAVIGSIDAIKALAKDFANDHQ